MQKTEKPAPVKPVIDQFREHVRYIVEQNQEPSIIRLMRSTGMSRSQVARYRRQCVENVKKPAN